MHERRAIDSSDFVAAVARIETEISALHESVAQWREHHEGEHADIASALSDLVRLKNIIIGVGMTLSFLGAAILIERFR